MIQAELKDIMLKNSQQPDALASPIVLIVDKYKQNCILLSLVLLVFSSVMFLELFACDCCNDVICCNDVSFCKDI